MSQQSCCLPWGGTRCCLELEALRQELSCQAGGEGSGDWAEEPVQPQPCPSETKRPRTPHLGKGGRRALLQGPRGTRGAWQVGSRTREPPASPSAAGGLSSHLQRPLGAQPSAPAPCDTFVLRFPGHSCPASRPGGLSIASCFLLGPDTPMPAPWPLHPVPAAPSQVPPPISAGSGPGCCHRSCVPRGQSVTKPPGSAWPRG